MYPRGSCFFLNHHHPVLKKVANYPRCSGANIGEHARESAKNTQRVTWLLGFFCSDGLEANKLRHYLGWGSLGDGCGAFRVLGMIFFEGWTWRLYVNPKLCQADSLWFHILYFFELDELVVFSSKVCSLDGIPLSERPPWFDRSEVRGISNLCWSHNLVLLVCGSWKVFFSLLMSFTCQVIHQQPLKWIPHDLNKSHRQNCAVDS